jgi:hypothetical protein
MSEKPFFIGWDDEPGSTPVAHSKSRAIILIVLVLVMVGVGAAWQTGFRAKGTWDFTQTTFKGILLAEPYPTLVSDDGVYYLVLENKEGVAVEDVAALDLNTVEVVGSLIEDPEQPVSMIAVKSHAAIASTGVAAADPLQHASLPREVTLRGEIIDSKCALGAMNPGVMKTHRACAINCLSGGIPPVLLVRHEGGTSATHYLLLNEDGKPIKEAAIEYAALPVAITGSVTEIGSWRILKANPSAIVLVP